MAFTRRSIWKKRIVNDEFNQEKAVISAFIVWSLMKTKKSNNENVILDDVDLFLTLICNHSEETLKSSHLYTC